MRIESTWITLLCINYSSLGFSLNLRKDLFMQRSRTKGDATAANVDGGVGDYNYANAQDKDFVPGLTVINLVSFHEIHNW